MVSIIYKARRILGLAGVLLGAPPFAVAQAEESAGAAEPGTGPVIENFGPVYAIPEARNPGALNTGLSAAFDVSEVGPAPQSVNQRIVTVARYLNMHGAAGVPADQLRAALVIHGGATRATLSNAAYRERFGVDNPNLPLLEALTDAGVSIYLCGQSAASRGYARDEISDLVAVSLSAMTAHVQLQTQGYALIPF